MSACYETAELLQKLVGFDPKTRLDKALQEVLPDLPPGEAKLFVIEKIGDALDEIAHLPNLNEDYVRQMVKSVRNGQSRILGSLAQADVNGLTSAGNARGLIQELTLIGHAVTGAMLESG